MSDNDYQFPKKFLDKNGQINLYKSAKQMTVGDLRQYIDILYELTRDITHKDDLVGLCVVLQEYAVFRKILKNRVGKK
jgi:hypothetical protein